MNNIDLNSLTEEQKKYLSQINELFVHNKTGKNLLECWKKFYFFREIIIENCPVESARRDGENRFIRKILINIEQFKQLQEENKNGINRTSK